jgi:hypothetical protein
MKHSISPYPANVKVVTHNKEESSIFQDGKKIGEVNYHLNWGTDWLAYFPPDTTQNKFFKTKTEAVKHLIEIHTNFKPAEKTLDSNQVAAIKFGDNVVIYFPEGEMKMSVSDYRRKVFQIEEEFGKEIVFI